MHLSKKTHLLAVLLIACSCIFGMVPLVDGASNVTFTKIPDKYSYAEIGKDYTMTYEYSLDNVMTSNLDQLSLKFKATDGSLYVLVKVKKDGSDLVAGADLSSEMTNLAGRISLEGNVNDLDKTVSWKLAGIKKEDNVLLNLCLSFGSGSQDVCSNTSKLVPATKPSFLREKETFKEGSSVDISCQAKGIPLPVMSWERVPDGVKLSSGSGLASLQFAAVDRQDSSVYRCKASNQLGEIESNLEIVVNYIDYDKTKTVTTIHTFIGASTTLRCEALGKPTPTITWTLPDGTVSSKTEKTLVVFPSTADFSKPYKCTITNSAGTKDIEISLINYGTPTISCKEYSVTVELTKSKTTHFIVRYRKKGDTNWLQEIRSNAPGTHKADFDLSSHLHGDFEVAVKAQNDAGMSPESAVKTCSGCTQIVAQLSCIIITFMLGKMTQW